MLEERQAEQALAISHAGDADMPRQRPRRRRRRTNTAAESKTRFVSPDDSQAARVEVSQRRSWLPTAGVVTAMGLGMWLGWAFSGVGGIVEQIVLWIGVLMAGLGGGRLFRRSIQRRRDQRR